MEDLKHMWQQYDEKLRKTQSMNEQLIRKLNSRNTTDQIDKMRSVEYLNMFVTGLVLIIFLLRFDAIGSRWEVVASYWLTVVQLIIIGAWTAFKLHFLGTMDIGKLQVTEMLRRITRFRLMLIRERLWGGLVLFLLFLPACTIVVDYWVNGANGIISSWKPLVLRAIPVVAVGIGVGLWVYRKFYMQPIEDIASDLRELAEFSVEDE